MRHRTPTRRAKKKPKKIREEWCSGGRFPKNFNDDTRREENKCQLHKGWKSDPQKRGHVRCSVCGRRLTPKKLVNGELTVIGFVVPPHKRK